MREIKFRAWDQRYKTWHLWGLNVNPETGAYFTAPPHNDLIHCQFTGLHDKNGKEVWEGDIVKRIAKRSCCGAVEYAIEGVVEWFCEGWVVRENGADIGGCAWANQKNEIIEVIGNIYETPELLEVKK